MPYEYSIPNDRPPRIASGWPERKFPFVCVICHQPGVSPNRWCKTHAGNCRAEKHKRDLREQRSEKR